MPPPSLSLKQRLANLQQSIAGPSSPTTATPQGQGPGRAFGALGAALGKRTRKPSFTRMNSWGMPGGETGMQAVDDVISKMIFQAGVDYETRPMIVMNASAFPDPRVVSYDAILSRILSYLDLFVESDYSVVFFAAGGHHTPSWNWVWKAYRSLSRKYRKNLKRLYIVHSSFFSKMLFSLSGTIISPKFFKKIIYIDSLSELACHVPLTQIDIPPAVYSENLKHEAHISLPTPTYSRMFGVALEDLMGFDGEKDGLPRVVRDCIQYLRATGLEDEGLFRRSPNSTQLRQVREAYNRGQTVSLHNFGDPHLAAVLIKKFLRDLPQPVFPERLYDVIRGCPAIRSEHDELDAISYIRNTLLPELAPCTLILLSNILLLFHEVSLRSDSNRMDAHNLAIVLTPNLVASGNPLKDVQICAVQGSPEPLSPADRSPPSMDADETRKRVGCSTLGTVIKICIHRYFEVFDEMADRAEALDHGPFSVGELEESEYGRSSHSSASVSPLTASQTSTLADGQKRLSTMTDDSSLDDTMLVMPLGPNGQPSPTNRQFTTPNSGLSASSRTWPPKGVVRSVHTGETHSANGTLNKARARSLIAPPTTDGVTFPYQARKRNGIATSISANSTLRKSTGSAVSAHSVTASGFFASSNSDAPPPVPPLPPPTHPSLAASRS